MKHPQLAAEYDILLYRRPSYVRVGIFSWIVWLVSGLIGTVFLFVAVANLVTGSLTLELLKAILQDEQVRQLQTEGYQAFIYLFSALCFLIALPFLFISWLTKAILRRNGYIAHLHDFSEKVLEEHKQAEHTVVTIREEIQRKIG